MKHTTVLATFLVIIFCVSTGSRANNVEANVGVSKSDLDFLSQEHDIIKTVERRDGKEVGSNLVVQRWRHSDKTPTFILDKTGEKVKEEINAAVISDGGKYKLQPIPPKITIGPISLVRDVPHRDTKPQGLPENDRNRDVHDTDFLLAKGTESFENDEPTTAITNSNYDSLINTKTSNNNGYVLDRSGSKESDSSFNKIDNICELTTEEAEFEPSYRQDILTDRRDMFNCSANNKCLCKYLNPTKEGHRHVLADCSDRHLHAIPSDLPGNVFNLTVSFNILPTFDLHDVFLYKSLQVFSATDCYIRNISNATSGVNPLMTLLDLRYNHIQSLSSRVFGGFPNLRQLLLSGNQIHYLKDDFFLGLSNLEFLDLSMNGIRRIDNGTFNDLSMLEKLALSGNYRLGYDVLTAELFKNLTRLKSLKIQGCSNGATGYPNEAIGVLKNLEDLNIDALANPAKFGPQFAELKRLKILSFGPYADCRLVNMSESFFEHFRNLTCLYIHSCNISSINSQAYSSFDNLKALTINSVPSMTLDKAFGDLAGFRIKSLEYIGFINLTRWYWPCIWLTKDQGYTMVGFNLTTINLSKNRLSLLSDSFIATMPFTLEKLILRYNKFTLINVLWTSLNSLKNLVYLDVSFQNRVSKDQHFPFQLGEDHSVKEDVIETIIFQNQTERQPIQYYAGEDEHLNTGIDYGVALNIPENLETVIASWYSFFGGVLLSSHVGKNHLKYLNFCRSGLHEWGSGKLPPDVELLDLSVNAASFINPDFFHPNNSLERLHIQVNFLGDFIAVANSSVWRNLKKLKYLDLSTNVIFYIPHDFFNELREVETISLTDNRLETLNASFEYTRNLKFLDLHKNSLSWISESTRNHLDQLAMRPSGMIVDLHYNYLMCTCDYISLLHWMVETNVYFLNMPLYQCLDITDKLIHIKDREAIKAQVNYLRRHCFSYGYLAFGIAAFSLIFVITLTAGVSYRYRWWIRYKKHVLFARWFGFKPKIEGSRDGLQYKYDAYLLYVRADRAFAHTCSKELEKVRSHKLCIGDRDILPGTNEIEAIVSAVQNSRTTLVAVTNNFISDMGGHFRDNPMLDYALQMALMEEYCTKRQTLHLILDTSCDGVNKYPRYILKVLRDGCMTRFPSDGETAVSIDDDMRRAFWDELSSTLGHGACCTDEDEDEDDDDDDDDDDDTDCRLIN